MKTIKRSIAFMLALVLTFAMSVTAFADEAKTYSITIDSAIPGHTYEAYQIFTGDLSEDETTPVSYTHLTLPTKSDECRSRWSPYH